ncbi:hypothetical protein KO465_04955 [Candidatus Micrarchaeota archaeon]|jgi:hypothetical protein|nr:hypothetical protein [Candidatus Micrarchaeota archaeon]
MKRLKTIGTEYRHVKVFYSRDWQEYQCKLYINGILQKGATYYTSDEQDAVDTAHKMLTEEEDLLTSVDIYIKSNNVEPVENTLTRVVDYKPLTMDEYENFYGLDEPIGKPLVDSTPLNTKYNFGSTLGGKNDT